MSLVRLVLVFAFLPFIACAGSVSEKGTTDLRRETTLALAAARCTGGSCRCRKPSEPVLEEGIPAGHKRFELRLSRSTSDIWLEIQKKGVFFKPAIPVSGACFYVDLPAPGQYTLRLAAKDRDAQTGLQLGMEINEYGKPYWYQSLKLVCGGLQYCGPQELKTWHDYQRKLPRGVLDPCGSSMVRGFSHSGVRRQRGDATYQELSLNFSLKVYEFAPHQKPHSPACKAPLKNR
jgi:hypothetical protein